MPRQKIEYRRNMPPDSPIEHWSARRMEFAQTFAALIYQAWTCVGEICTWQICRVLTLSDSNLQYTQLPHCNLADANLSRANLGRTNLSHANLSHADVAEARLEFAVLVNCNLSYANMVRANLRQAKIDGADFSYADLSGVDMSNPRSVVEEETLYRVDGELFDRLWQEIEVLMWTLAMRFFSVQVCSEHS